MINVPRLYSQRIGEAGGAGAGCRNFARLQLDGEVFFLTSPFIERSGSFQNRSRTRIFLPTLSVNKAETISSSRRRSRREGLPCGTSQEGDAIMAGRQRRYRASVKLRLILFANSILMTHSSLKTRSHHRGQHPGPSGAQRLPHRAERRIHAQKASQARRGGAAMKTAEAPFPFTSMFQNGPRRQASAPQTLFKPGKDFPPPRKNRAPLPAPGRSENLALEKGKGANAKPKPFSVRSLLPPPFGRHRRHPVMLTRPRNPKIRSPPLDDVNNLRHHCKCQRRFASTAIQIRRNAVGIRNRIDEDGGPLIHNGSSNAPSTRPAAGA